MRWRRPLVIAALVASCAALTMGAGSSCGTATDDRTGPNGAQPDAFQDAQHVVVYRNADNVPNVAVFCLGAFGWASTLSGTDAGENKSSTLVRFESYDKTCAS